MQPSNRVPGSPPPRSPQRPPPLDLSAVRSMRLTPDRCSFGGVETPGDQEARGAGASLPLSGLQSAPDHAVVPVQGLRMRRAGKRAV